MKANKKYKVIGIMSGTSMDGLDIAYCNFAEKKKYWEWEIVKANTIKYPGAWSDSLARASQISSIQLIELSNKYGVFIGKQITDFIKKHELEIDFIASHGHTVFHQPEKKITCQIGNGASIAAETGITTVCDFRTLDVALGGQGAPLVPCGDKLLFPDYSHCLNLGGFANISFDENKKRIAFDVCPVNIIMNSLAGESGLPYDKDGLLASKGKINNELLKKLNGLSYYKKSYPKSLGREWLEKYFSPLVYSNKLSTEDRLRTIYEHISIQIASVIHSNKNAKLLITGGGAHNKFLISLLRNKISVPIILPDPLVIDFKEALIFAFLGVLRMQGKNNCLASVTGAKRDSCGGAVYSSKI